MTLRGGTRGVRRVLSGIARRPGYGLATVLILGLGIGANTAIFSVVSAVLLRPLPFSNPDRLVVVREASPERGLVDIGVSPPTLRDWREAQQTFEGLAAFTDGYFVLTGGNEPRRISGANVTADFFSLLGLPMAAGRSFAPEDDEEGAAPVVILSHALWQQQFGGDRGVIGATLTLDDQAYEIIGVASEGIDYPSGAEVWTPLMPAIPGALGIRGARFLFVLGRLRPGVTPGQAETDLAAVAEGIPELAGWEAQVVPLHQRVTGDVRTPLYVLLAAVAFVLLIACANVANLILARTASRRRELAIRSALGAGRLRIAGSLVGESVLLSVAGGAVGVLLAGWGLDLILALNPGELPRIDEIAIDATVLAYALGVSLVTGVLAGSLPALRYSRPDLTAELKEGSISVAGGIRANRLRSALLVGEVAVSLVLLAGAGLMVKSFVRLTRVDPGFQADRVLAFELSLPGYRYERAEEGLEFARRLLDRVESVPGVEVAAISRNLPLTGRSMTSPVILEKSPDSEDRTQVQVSSITPDYFRAMGIELVRGRDFADSDRADRVPVAIVNEAFARQFFPADPVLGQRVATYFGKKEMREIVGVVRDVHHASLIDPAPPKLYTPMAQDPALAFMLLARSGQGNAATIPAVKAIIRHLDPDLPVASVMSMRDLLARSLARPRFYGLTLGLFAALAVALALAGLYAVMANTVAQRRREIGVRLALGARSGRVTRMVVGEGLVLTAVGVALGLLAASMGTRLLSGLLFGVSASDATVFVGCAVLMFAVGAGATYLPARSASRIDPMLTLRE